MEKYEVIVVGGGPAGLTTALYTTRLGHKTALFDKGGGRAAMMLDTHNVIGVTEDVSGNEFLSTGLEQVKEYGGSVYREAVTNVERNDDGTFTVTADDSYISEAVVLGTGFRDESPDPPLPRTGRGLHWCLHCDAYMFIGESIYVMGHSDSAAHVAMIMLNFTDEVDLLTRGNDPDWSDETQSLLDNHPIDIIHEDVKSINKGDDGWPESFVFEDGSEREYRGGFAMYGANHQNKLAENLGCELNEDGTVKVDDHGQTSVENVYALGDITQGHNQIPVAMGEGAKTGIDVHKTLRKFPSDEPVTKEDAPDIPPQIWDAAREWNY